MTARAALLAAVPIALAASSAHAQEPPAPAPAPTPAPAPAPTPAPAPATTAVQAPPPPETGIELGARLGFALPFGDLANGLSGALPVWIDAGYRLHALVLGVYGHIGPAFLGGNCLGCTSAYALSFGAEAQYRLAPVLGLVPWAGLGAGFAMASISAMGGASSSSGVEFVNVQLGLDAPQGFGPFAAFSVGSYGADGKSSTNEWLTLGVRGTVDW
jgi:hypothetical protein